MYINFLQFLSSISAYAPLLSQLRARVQEAVVLICQTLLTVLTLWLLREKDAAFKTTGIC